MAGGIALIINEFGETGVDGELVKGCKIEGCPEENIVELANGCICCTVADDFLPTMRALLDRPNPPEHIVIETSGLALPKPLVKAFNWPEVRTRVTVDGVIAVVDGPAAAAGRFADNLDAVAAQRSADAALDHDSPIAELFEDQINCADLIVLNKNDQMDDAARTAAMAAINHELKRAAKVVPCQLRRDRSQGAAGPRRGGGGRPRQPLFASRAGGRGSRPRRVHLVPPRPAAARRSRKTCWRRLLPAIERHDILRVKGFLDVAGKEMRLVLQGVGPRLQHYYDRAWAPGEDRSSRLVVIGLKGLDHAAIARDLGLWMHLLAAKPGQIADGSEAIDLGQTAGDIVVLSAADSELACLSRAYAHLAGTQAEPALGEPAAAVAPSLGRCLCRGHRRERQAGGGAAARRRALLAVRHRAGLGRVPEARHRARLPAGRRPARPGAERSQHDAAGRRASAVAVPGARRARERVRVPALWRQPDRPRDRVARAAAVAARRALLAGQSHALARGPARGMDRMARRSRASCSIARWCRRGRPRRSMR